MSLTALFDVPAPAKLNLFLHVIGRRDDGYHLLQSVFALIDWCDVLHFERRDDALLQRHDLGPALPADDLCLRAARALQTASGTRRGVDISIDKRLPWGAGLGGGSSDAASTLLALNRLWGLQWSRRRLMALALQIGADVPFFVGGRNAWVEGVGEQLTVLDLPVRWWAVLKPAVAVPTASVFASPALVRDTAPATLRDFFADPFGFGRNDLQRCVCAFGGGGNGSVAGDVGGSGPARADGTSEGSAGRQVDQALALLKARFGASRMTGSGSAVFAEAGAGESPEPAMLGHVVLPPDWVARMCRGLAEHPLVGWAQDVEQLAV